MKTSLIFLAKLITGMGFFIIVLPFTVIYGILLLLLSSLLILSMTIEGTARMSYEWAFTGRIKGFNDKMIVTEKLIKVIKASIFIR